MIKLIDKNDIGHYICKWGWVIESDGRINLSHFKEIMIMSNKSKIYYYSLTSRQNVKVDVKNKNKISVHFLK